MFISPNFARILKVVVAGLAILAATCIPAAGQSEEDVERSQLPNLPDPNDGHDLLTELNQGVRASKNGHLDEAILHFQEAMKLAPDQPGFKIYLGNALAQKVAPGVDTPENLKIAQQAINLYQEVIFEPTGHRYILSQPVTDQRFITVKAMTQIARINFSIKKLDESKTWQKKVLAEEPKDAEAAFAVGVIDWMQARQNAQAALTQAGLKDDGEGNAKAPAAVMESIKTRNAALVEEGLKYLSQAVYSKPGNENAMTYLDLTYRRKADLDWADEAARKADLLKAVEWRQKAIDAHKANQEIKSAAAPLAKP